MFSRETVLPSPHNQGRTDTLRLLVELEYHTWWLNVKNIVSTISKISVFLDLSST